MKETLATPWNQSTNQTVQQHYQWECRKGEKKKKDKGNSYEMKERARLTACATDKFYNLLSNNMSVM